MKTVVIGGVSRTGKSQLANQLWKRTKSTVFHADHLTHVLANHFSDTFSRDPNDPRYSSLEYTLIKLIRNMGKEFGYLRIFESSILSPEKASAKLIPEDQYTTLFLGYPKVDAYHKLHQIRNFAQSYPHCWSHGLTDKKVLYLVRQFIERSRELQHECAYHKIPFVDTSTNIQEKLAITLANLLKQV